MINLFKILTTHQSIQFISLPSTYIIILLLMKLKIGGWGGPLVFAGVPPAIGMEIPIRSLSYIIIKHYN